MIADPPARMATVDHDSLTHEARLFLDRWTGGIFKDADANPVLLTLAHHPQLGDLFSQFNIHILASNTLPVKLRQIAIMRTAWICKATYMWSSHLNTSVLSGLSPEMYEPIKIGANDPYFDELERGVIRATEELVNDKKIGSENWAILSTELSDKQMLDFIFTVGCYVLLAGFMRSAQVERPPDLVALAKIYGQPE